MVELAPILDSQRGPRSEVTQRLPEILANYLRYHRIEGSTPSTLIHKNKEIGAFVKWLEGEGHSLLPEAVTIEDIEGHLAWMLERGLSVNSRHTRLRSIKAWFNWMVERRRIPESPARGIKPPKLPDIRKPFIDKAQFDALLALCPVNRLLGARRQAMLWLLITSGLRINELAMLKVEDVDWDREMIRVLHGKGQKERQVPFSRDAQRPMSRYLEQRQFKGFNSEWLWVSEEGNRFNDPGQDIARLMERAGVQVKDRCHVFRRTFAAQLFQQGATRVVVCALLGWSVTSPMPDRYVAWLAGEQGAIAAVRDFKPFGA